MTVRMPEKRSRTSRFRPSAIALRNQAIVLGAFVVLFWVLEGIDWLPLTNLDQGVRPRDGNPFP